MDIANDLTEEHVNYFKTQTDSPDDVKILALGAPKGMEDEVSTCLGIEYSQRNEEQPLCAAQKTYAVSWKPNEIEVAMLAQGGRVWVNFVGGVPPHFVDVTDR